MAGHLRPAGLVLAVAGGLVTLLGGAALLAAPPVREVGVHLRAGRSLQALPFDLAVALLAVAVLAGCLLWLAVVVGATVVEVATGLSSRLVTAATPALVRRVVVAAATVALGGTAAVAPAVAAPQDGRPVTAPVDASTTALVGLPLPDRATGSPPQPRRPRTVTVRPGDTLWGLAEAHLPSGSGAAQVDRAWRELYRLNHASVGPDPHHLQVGTVLRLPTSLDTTDARTRKDTP